MVIIIILALLFILFFILRKHAGPAQLAVIAGVCAYDFIGKTIVHGISNVFHSAPKNLLEIIVFLIIVLILPLLLYIRSGHDRIYGVLRILEALTFSVLLTTVCSWCIAYFIPLDGLSKNIVASVSSFKGIIVIVGIVFAYFDIMFCKDKYNY